MGYFSNGTEGMDYEEHYCHRCIHDGPEEGPGCPVWLAHLLHNYEQHKDEQLASVLNILIPRDEDGWNQQCSMFTEPPKVAVVFEEAS